VHPLGTSFSRSSHLKCIVAATAIDIRFSIFFPRYTFLDLFSKTSKLLIIVAIDANQPSTLQKKNSALVALVDNAFPSLARFVALIVCAAIAGIM
jgi:hypothetical protein